MFSFCIKNPEVILAHEASSSSKSLTKAVFSLSSLPSNNKMSSTTTGRSRLPRAERRRRGGSGRTENQRAASTAGRAKRTRRLSWTRWEICPKTESRRRDRTPRAPLWTSEEVRVRSFSDSVKHVEQHPLKWSGNVEWFISRKCLTKETFKFYDFF